jgi:cysteine synthase A
MKLVDYTSGNGGASLAFIAREKGYQAIVAMPANMTKARIKQIKRYGAELVLTDPDLFLAGARAEAEKIVNECNRNLGPGGSFTEKALLINQSENPNNVLAYRRLVHEITRWEKSDIFGPHLITFVGAIGTGSSTTGIAQLLREEGKRLATETLVVGFEASESATSFAAKQGFKAEIRPHNLIGVSPGKVAKNTDLSLIDRVEPVTAAEVEEGKRLLSELNFYLLGHTVGPTSAVALYLAKKYAEMLGEDTTILTVFYDAGWKYE